MPTENEVDERMGEQKISRIETSATNRVAAELVHGGAS
jgi:hypothetical protein